MAEARIAKTRSLPKANAPALAAPAGDGRVRAVIDAVLPAVDAGRFAVKRVAGEPVTVTAHCFTDGHDVLRVMLRWRAQQETEATEVEMVARGNDEWHAQFVPPAIGRYRYSVVAWVDPFESWRHEMARRVDADDIRIASLVGAHEISGAAQRAAGSDRKALSASGPRSSRPRRPGSR